MPVYLVDDFLKSAKPPADAIVDYGPRDEHCWSGDHTTFNGVSRLTYIGALRAEARGGLREAGARGGGREELAVLTAKSRRIFALATAGSEAVTVVRASDAM